MSNPFTAVDNSIDIVVAVIFMMVIFWAVHYIWENHLTTQAKIMYLAIIVISGMQVFQVITQILLQSFANFRIWDVINFVTAMLFLAMVHRMAKKEKL